MTVKKIPYEHKAHVAHCYVHENQSTAELALAYSVSARTINRVLVEMGVARTPRVKPKPTPVVVPVEQAAPLQIEMFPEQTFFEKSIALFKRIIAKLFPQTNA